MPVRRCGAKMLLDFPVGCLLALLVSAKAVTPQQTNMETVTGRLSFKVIFQPITKKSDTSCKRLTKKVERLVLKGVIAIVIYSGGYIKIHSLALSGTAL